jgi:hypothetical protein
MRAVQGPAGSEAWSTATVMVVLSPGRSTPLSRLSRSQEAPVDADQRTSEPPLAVRVMTVTSPRGSAATVRRPGPGTERSVPEEAVREGVALRDADGDADRLAEPTETLTLGIRPDPAESATPAFS